MLKKNDIIVSVIIPAYNEEKYLGKCLDSLQNQTYPYFEIIVIDDGSKDKTKYIASKYKVKLWSISHGGPGRAKNFGASKAIGEILVFLDADMFANRDYLQKIIDPIIQGDAISTYTLAEYIANGDNIWAKCWNINSDLPENRRIPENNKTRGLAFRAIRRDKFINTGGYDPKLGYIDDRSLVKYGIFSKPVINAVCYHYNPETLQEVYFSARWIGRSAEFKLTLRNLIRYSFINSIRLSIRKFTEGAPIEFFIFKLIFDFGILSGLLFRNERYNYSK